MTNIVEQDELGLDLGIGDSNEPDAEMRIPAPFCRRTRIEQDRFSFPINERFVTVTEYDQVDVRTGGGASRFQRRLTVVAMQQQHNA